MPARPGPIDATPLRGVLGAHPGLGQLLALARESAARLAALQDRLPRPLAAQVRAGPLDEQSWTLLVDSPAAAAKLRQMLPALQDRLCELGWPAPPPRVRVLPRR